MVRSRGQAEGSDRSDGRSQTIVMTVETSLFLGLSLLILGGFIDGSLGIILKYPKSWNWEHLWLTYAFLAFEIIPWVVGSLTINDLGHVLKSANNSDIALVFFFGLGWGCGAVLYGLALKYAGMALTYAIVMGLTAALGSFAPLAMFHRSEIFTLRGQLIVAAVLLVVFGVVLCAQAANLKERALAAEKSQSATWIGGHTMFGVLLAVVSGVLSPMINLSFVYGAPLAKLAVENGTDPLLAPNVIWIIALSAGGAVNVAYCSLVIGQKRSWDKMTHWSGDWLLGLLMGLLGPASLILYGMGNSQLGELGPVIGWPIMSSMGILGANLWGALTGEWKDAGKRPILLMGSAAAMLIAAMFILGCVETLN